MSDTYAHKLLGKVGRYYAGMQEWWNEGTLYSGYPHWPEFLFGPMPIWWQRINSDRKHYKYLDRIKRRMEDKRVARDLPRGSWPAKKDTKRWCRGRVGREHDVEMVPYRGYDGAMLWMYERCRTCRKHLRRHYDGHELDRALA